MGRKFELYEVYEDNSMRCCGRIVLDERPHDVVKVQIKSHEEPSLRFFSHMPGFNMNANHGSGVFLALGSAITASVNSFIQRKQEWKQKAEERRKGVRD